MIKKLKDNSLAIGLGLTIALAAFVMGLSIPLFLDPTREPFLSHVGVDTMGSLVCAALFFGCMKQSGEGTRTFRALIIFVSACFAVNEAVCAVILVPELRSLCLSLCMVAKLIDLVMIYCFYNYIDTTLHFNGELAKWTERILPVLLILQSVVILSNVFYPVTFYIDADGMYQATAASILEDVYLASASLMATILIIKSRSQRNQKAAALTFIYFPLIEYVLMGGQFGNSGQYGTVLLSLIIMYCNIFIDKTRELLATQADLAIAAKIQADALPPAAPKKPTL